MRFFLLVSLFSAAIAIAQDIFSTDPSPLGDSPLFPGGLDEYDSTDMAGGSDPLLSFSPLADSDSSQLEFLSSSCQSENSDPVSWSKVRARGDVCNSPDQSTPVKDNLLDGAARIGQSIFDKLKLGPMDEEDDDPEHFNTLINNWKCYPAFPHNLCCENKESFSQETFMGQEVTLYYNWCFTSRFFALQFLEVHFNRLIHSQLLNAIYLMYVANL